MNHPPSDIIAKLRNPPPQMKVWLDGDDRFHTTLTIYSLYNPDVSAVELEEIVAEILDGSDRYPSLKGLYP
jgi:hypothetical protein